MRSFLFILVIIWFILGASAANDRGFFDTGNDRDCSYIGSGLLTVVAGPLSYAGRAPDGGVLVTGGSASRVPSHAAAT